MIDDDEPLTLCADGWTAMEKILSGTTLATRSAVKRSLENLTYQKDHS